MFALASHISSHSAAQQVIEDKLDKLSTWFPQAVTVPEAMDEGLDTFTSTIWIPCGHWKDQQRSIAAIAKHTRCDGEKVAYAVLEIAQQLIARESYTVLHCLQLACELCREALEGHVKEDKDWWEENKSTAEILPDQFADLAMEADGMAAIVEINAALGSIIHRIIELVAADEDAERHIGMVDEVRGPAMAYYFAAIPREFVNAALQPIVAALGAKFQDSSREQALFQVDQGHTDSDGDQEMVIPSSGGTGGAQRALKRRRAHQGMKKEKAVTFKQDADGGNVRKKDKKKNGNDVVSSPRTAATPQRTKPKPNRSQTKPKPKGPKPVIAPYTHLFKARGLLADEENKENEIEMSDKERDEEDKKWDGRGRKRGNGIANGRHPFEKHQVDCFLKQVDKTARDSAASYVMDEMADANTLLAGVLAQYPDAQISRNTILANIQLNQAVSSFKADVEGRFVTKQEAAFGRVTLHKFLMEQHALMRGLVLYGLSREVVRWNLIAGTPAKVKTQYLAKKESFRVLWEDLYKHLASLVQKVLITTQNGSTRKVAIWVLRAVNEMNDYIGRLIIPRMNDSSESCADFWRHVAVTFQVNRRLIADGKRGWSWEDIQFKHELEKQLHNPYAVYAVDVEPEATTTNTSSKTTKKATIKPRVQDQNARGCFVCGGDHLWRNCPTVKKEFPAKQPYKQPYKPYNQKPPKTTNRFDPLLKMEDRRSFGQPTRKDRSQTKRNEYIKKNGAIYASKRAARGCCRDWEDYGRCDRGRKCWYHHVCTKCMKVEDHNAKRCYGRRR